MIALLVCLLFGHAAPPPPLDMLALTLTGGLANCRRCGKRVELERDARRGRAVVKRPGRAR